MEFYENLRSATLNAAIPANFNGWTISRNTSLGVVLDGSDYVLVGKGADTGSKRIARTGIPAGKWGRIEAKVKYGSNVAADYAAANNFSAVGFINIADPTGVTGANKRVLQMTYETAGSNVGVKFWNGTINVAKLLDVAAIPINEWLILSVVHDGDGQWTSTITKESDGTILGSNSTVISADAGKAFYSYVDFGFAQNASDGGGWGTQYKYKDIIVRDDFEGYDEFSQRRHLNVAPQVNGDTCYVTVPKNWRSETMSGNAILSGHGYGATISFSTTLSKPFPDRGFVYGQSNTHGETWGNDQAVSDIEAMRQWMVDKCGISDRVFMYGASMGCLAALSYAATYPQNVKKIVTEIGVCSIQAIYKNATYTASINTAFGVTRFRDIPKAHDPIQSVEKYVDIPIMQWVGLADTTAPHGLHSRPFSERLAKLGGTVMYIEEPGETHSLDIDPDKYADFFYAEVGLGGNGGSKTAIVYLEESSVYEITTKYPGIASYILDNVQGALTLIPSKTTIRTKHRPMSVLIKLTDTNYNLSHVSIRKVP